MLGNGLAQANHDKEALPVQEAELALLRRLGTSEFNMLGVQCNLAVTYEALGQEELALSLQRDVYSGCVRYLGEEHEKTLLVANNHASSLINLDRFEEAKALLRKVVPVARRVLGESHEFTLKSRWLYAAALCNDPAATLTVLREAVTTLEDTARISRRVFGGAHPMSKDNEHDLRKAREALAARETPQPGSR